MKISKESGQVSRLLLVLAVVVLVAAIIVYLVMRMASPPPAPDGPDTTEVPLPVYEQQLGDIKFSFISSINKGSVLRASEIRNKQYISSYQKDITTTERFIQVTVGAKNMGTANTEINAWTLENIVDSEGRNFVPEEGYSVAAWLPDPNLCGALLKPAFDPTPCTKIYAVSKESTGLKIRVQTGLENKASNLTSGKIDSFLLDLIVK